MKLAILAAAIFVVSTAQAFDCNDANGTPTCHALAYCVSQGQCECMPGTRDISSGTGTNCEDTGYAVRYVVTADLDAASFSMADVSGLYCPSDATGFYMKPLFRREPPVSDLEEETENGTTSENETTSDSGGEFPMEYEYNPCAVFPFCRDPCILTSGQYPGCSGYNDPCGAPPASRPPFCDASLPCPTCGPPSDDPPPADVSETDEPAEPLNDWTNNTLKFTVIYCIYASEDAASTALGGSFDFAGASYVTPGVYRWVLPTTSNPIEVPPAGLELDSVSFDIKCATSGCWVLKGVLTTGHNLMENTAFNTFFLPSASVESQDISYDFDYTSGGIQRPPIMGGAPIDVPVEWTFFPAKHPCTSANFDASNANTQEVTTCCITNVGIGETGGEGGTKGGFLANYRTTTAFEKFGDSLADCAGGSGNGEVIERQGYGRRSDFDVAFPSNPLLFLQGAFTDMPNSPGVVDFVLKDPFFAQFSFTIELDEVELRSKAGKLKGTVGVEHTVDTFLGLGNFRVTGLEALDTFATQVAIHLEKTSFFSVSTHGTNDYTFLEYVNMRLVTIYLEDSDFSGTDESGAGTVRTSSANAADYVQVTFTLGSQYEVNAESGLIPLESVRAGSGTFLDDAATVLDHKCMQWDDELTGTFTDKEIFEGRLGQTCAPGATMCSSPSSIPDSFVSFNIPLGIASLPDASSTLSNNIFVDMVISAVDETAAGTPNDGDVPQQMKTTLTASIPVVEGGVNIFCDGYTSKTDLKDVVNADIVVGSASSSDELTRLRIKEDIASTQLEPSSVTQIDSDSIEAGLMTLVLKGNTSYFQSNTGRQQVTLELEDVITVHIMESDGSGETTDVSSSVMDLITSSPDDNADSNGLDTDGYALNGAFYFTIDRSAQRAHLEPSDDLLALCPFNPPRPDNSMMLETCVVRRDVRYRGFPNRAGAHSTAMEICTAGSGACDGSTSSDESRFFTTMFGASDYARNLAVDYAAVIAAKYSLNGRYRRAYWINPGYEWTPTQTGGTPLFSVSQKLYMFALITLDEGIASDKGAEGAAASLPAARRMLLQSTPDQALQDGQSSLNAEALEFQTTPTSMMAKAFGVHEDRVATFKVTLQLTQAEACLSQAELQASIRATLDDYLSGAASAFYTVQVTKMVVDTAGVQCGRRSVRGLLSSFSEASAEVTMLVVFKEGTAATISLDKLQTMPGIASAEPLSVSPKVDTAAAATFVPPPSSDDDSSSSPSIGLIAGAAAGGAVAVAALAAMVFFLRPGRRDRSDVCAVVQTINVNDLKHQLVEDV